VLPELQDWGLKPEKQGLSPRTNPIGRRGKKAKIRVTALGLNVENRGTRCSARVIYEGFAWWTIRSASAQIKRCISKHVLIHHSRRRLHLLGPLLVHKKALVTPMSFALLSALDFDVDCWKILPCSSHYRVSCIRLLAPKLPSRYRPWSCHPNSRVRLQASHHGSRD